MKRPPLTPLVASLPTTVPFVGPETQERARSKPFAARLGANENGFGPAPSVVTAMAEAASAVWMYGDPENHDLKQALAAHCLVKAENIVVGEGIDGLLGLIVRQYVKEGTPVVTSLGAYPTFNYHVSGFGGRLLTVPYRDDKEDMDALLETVIREDAPLVFLANPDNPMGSWHEADAVQAFIDALPETTLLVLDEAYSEFAPASAVPPLDVGRPNILRMRTFSKAYGLAGLRCGYAIGEAQTIAAFDKVRNHFGMTRMAQAAALAALADQDYLTQTVAKVVRSRQRISDIAADHGLAALPSATNFVAIDCGKGPSFAAAVMAALADMGVFVRKPMAPGLDRCIRVSCGPDRELDIFADCLATALSKASG